MAKKVAVIGTVGVPAQYGGFETLAENLSRYLNTDFDITVFCSSKSYSLQLESHNNCRLIYIPLNANGISSIPYDIYAMLKALRFADVILVLGVSGCLMLPLIKAFSRQKILVNIDGLEWKRAKWNRLAKIFLQFSEKMAVRYSDGVITDNRVIQEYVRDRYGRDSTLIPYGADHAQQVALTPEIRGKYRLGLKHYAFSVCRIEPENNVHVILEAFIDSDFPLFFVGNWENSEYGRNLRKEYRRHDNIHLLDPIYDQEELDQLRGNAGIYLHGHSAGGTNPSLVEAMFLGLPVICFDVAYNRATTENKALFFTTAEDIVSLIGGGRESFAAIGGELRDVALRNYTWERVVGQYRELIFRTLPGHELLNVPVDRLPRL